MDWSLVGNIGNAADPTTGFGSVAYEYRIGTFEVTNAQYAAFLNAVADTFDPYGLYNPSMNGDPRGGIIRLGIAGNYSYTAKLGMGNKPVNFVSWYDIARMCNWMTNGQGSGGTESGVYTFDGISSINAVTRDLSNPDQVFIPTEDEWYKAAYFQPACPGNGTNSYWIYATQSNSSPAVAQATASGDVANPGANVANYFRGADWDGLDGHVTTVGSAESTSPSGAFDMNGNVAEWNEALLVTQRGVRGGSWADTTDLGLRREIRSSFDPTWELGGVGFRLASPSPGPSCAADVSGDGEVDLADLNLILANFGEAACDADTNGDGDVDLADLNAVLAVFGTSCP